MKTKIEVNSIDINNGTSDIGPQSAASLAINRMLKEGYSASINVHRGVSIRNRSSFEALKSEESKLMVVCIPETRAPHSFELDIPSRFLMV